MPSEVSTETDEDHPRERRFALPLGRVNGDVRRHYQRPA